MGDNIIKFGKVKKALARKAKQKKAAENCAYFGQKKSAKEMKKALTEKLQTNLDRHKLDGHKLDKAKSDKPTDND